MDSQLLDLAARMPSYCVAACAVALVVAVKFSQRSKVSIVNGSFDMSTPLKPCLFP